jgi:hypothetical protein
MTVTFLAGPGDEGNSDIDFWVLLLFRSCWAMLMGQITSPSGTQLIKEDRMQNGDFSFDATEDGFFRYCFSNVVSRLHQS